MKYMHEVAFTAFLNMAIPSSSLRGSDGSVGTNTVTFISRFRNVEQAC